MCLILSQVIEGVIERVIEKVIERYHVFNCITSD